jgi:hypothetical protein
MNTAVIAAERVRVRHGARVAAAGAAGLSVARIVILQIRRRVPILNRYFGPGPWLDLPANGTRSTRIPATLRGRHAAPTAAPSLLAKGHIRKS